MEYESENVFLHRAKSDTKHHSNPYIESTTVLSDKLHIGVPIIIIINPRRACAARVTVVVLCVCLSATILALQATRRVMSDTNSFSAIYKGKKNNVAILLKRLRSRDTISQCEKKRKGLLAKYA